MSKIKWDETGKRLYETGVDHGVLFPMGEDNAYGKGVPWYGLSAVNESPSGGEPNAVWADNIKYLNLMSAEDFGATIEAYTYPDEFEACNGCAEIAPGVTIAQQDRKMFGFCYRTLIGNDTVGTNYGYKLHLVYGAQASPSEKNNQTVNDSPEAITLSWEVSSIPVEVAGMNPTSVITIDSTIVDETDLAALELLLYGGGSGQTETFAKMPTPAEVVAIFA